MSSNPNPFISNSKSARLDSKWPSHSTPSLSQVTPAPGMIAHSVEFVAKPHEAARAQAVIPSALTGILKDVTCFAGCLVMASQYEARLVTIVTLWTGHEAQKRCTANVRWIDTILAPYVDRRLRVQTLISALPVTLVTEAETLGDAPGSIRESVCPQGEEMCLA